MVTQAGQTFDDHRRFAVQAQAYDPASALLPSLGDVECAVHEGNAVPWRVLALGDHGDLAALLDAQKARGREHLAVRVAGLDDVDPAVVIEGNPGREGEICRYDLDPVAVRDSDI